ncbi:MAG: threonine synthase [Microthrixaceae bacterium]
MRYVSTRGSAQPLEFAEVLLEGLATDGGLYVPEAWPALPDLSGDADYVETATAVMWPFVEGSISHDDFASIVADAYSTFEPPQGSTPDVVPVSDLGDNHFLAEIYWGPTLAFKDIALQLVGRLFDHELERRHDKVTIVGATSGDTGSAAIEACRDREHIDIFILHPEGRTSEVQRRQMTTVPSDNVHNIAIEGTFDDCQDLVKALFADEEFRRRVKLSAVNSINWARVMGQIVYYVTSARSVNRRLGHPLDAPVAFTVPTGNFGNIFAGYAAMKMGLAISQLVVASNTNDILYRFFTTGRMDIEGVTPTLSPSMDIQVSSNLERLLFEMVGRDGAAIAELMMAFRADNTASVAAEQLAWLSETFSAGRYTDDECLALIGALYRESGKLIDPHTAVGVGVARSQRWDPEIPMITLGTAHPAKFPDAVEEATGVRPALPEHLADLFDRPERFEVLAADAERLKHYVSSHLTAHG